MADNSRSSQEVNHWQRIAGQGVLIEAALRKEVLLLRNALYKAVDYLEENGLPVEAEVIRKMTPKEDD